MSVLIRGMEMPTSCEKCPFLDYEEGFCLASYEQKLCPGGIKDGRHEDCPLIPVPPHGDLIDRDELKAKQQEDADLFINAYTLMEKSRRDEALNAVANIINAPTIISADDKDTNVPSKEEGE